METTRGAHHPTRFEDLAVTIDFHCQSACKFCIVQEGMNHYRGLSFERFQALVDDNARSGKYGRVIFTGGEVTLEHALPDFARYAAASGAFAHVRLQTNARKLANFAYAESLVEAGINEFFVSLHGPTAAIQDAISQRPGSFDEALRGLANLQRLGVRIITNTVMTRDNVAVLSDIVSLAARHGVGRAELWNYLPMADPDDAAALLVPMGELVPALARALDTCRAAGLEGVVKYVPRCLLGAHADALDNGQPDVLIVESFWDRFPRFDCLYEGVCEQSEACLGLHHPYIRKHGWEEQTLRPTPRTRPSREREVVQQGRPERYGAERPGHGPWEALLAELPTEVGRVEGLTLTRNQARYRLRAPGGATVELVLAARDDGARALARSASFNLFYAGLAGDPAPGEMERLVHAAVALVQARDAGELGLEARKGLLETRRPRP